MNPLEALPSGAGALAELRRICEARAPLEACGVIFHGPAGHRVVELRNALPAAAARTAYAFDPGEQLRLWTDARGRGETLRVLFHSHVDAPARFSPQDHADGFADGAPLYPGVAYLILSVQGGRAVDAQLHQWEGSRLLSVPVPPALWRTA